MVLTLLPTAEGKEAEATLQQEPLSGVLTSWRVLCAALGLD